MTNGTTLHIVYDNIIIGYDHASYCICDDEEDYDDDAVHAQRHVRSHMHVSAHVQNHQHERKIARANIQ